MPGGARGAGIQPHATLGESIGTASREAAGAAAATGAPDAAGAARAAGAAPAAPPHRTAQRRAAGLADTVERASSGALALLPVARVKNLVRAMEQMKEAGYWLIGLDERADKYHTDVDLSGSVGIVLGREGEGLHELTRKRCDFLVSIPTTGPVRSLNVSVAAGVMLFEVVRQRSLRKPETRK